MKALPASHPVCGDCGPCRVKTSALLRVPRSTGDASVPGAKPVTAAALERHAKRFGPRQVHEVAAAHGLSVSVERPQRAPRGSRGPSLTKRVINMLRDGHTAETIAEVENLNPGRAKRVIEKAQERMAKQDKRAASAAHNEGGSMASKTKQAGTPAKKAAPSKAKSATTKKSTATKKVAKVAAPKALTKAQIADIQSKGGKVFTLPLTGQAFASRSERGRARKAAEAK